MTAGTPILTPEGAQSLITASEAASLCGVTTSAICKWVERGYLTASGLDDKGRKMYRLLDVAKAERSTRHLARR